jgi:hypothetical protein
MRCTYAYANEDSAANTANLAEANQVWLADFINRIKEKRV